LFGNDGSGPAANRAGGKRPTIDGMAANGDEDIARLNATAV
jgi:hypothetical protein